MIIIPNKVVTEKDEEGNDMDVNYPTEPLPAGLRIHCDGTNWFIAESKDDETTIIDSCPSLKVIVEEQKLKSVPSDPVVIDP